MRILALDLASNCGFAYNSGTEYHCGTWQLATEQELKAARKQRLNRRLDPRVTKLFTLVEGLQQLHEFHVITFEDIQFQSYTLQTQLWASLRGAMWTGAFKFNPIFDAVPVSTLKRFATGNGKATKEMMIAALIKSDPAHFSKHEGPMFANWHPDVRTKIRVDDNAVDAVWLWKRANQLFNR